MPVTLLELWLPIVLGALAMFLLSFVFWMLMKHHYGDFRALPQEDGLVEALDGAPAGQFRFPWCGTPEEMADPAFQERYNNGPKGFVVVLPRGPFAMGAGLGKTLLFCLVVTAAVGYVATIGLTRESAGMDVLRLTSTVTWLTACGAHGWSVIWMGRDRGQTLRDVLDSLGYGLAVGALFMQFWPGA